MSYTLVTSFILQKNDIGNTKKIEDYMNRFEYIRNLNLPTVVFLDKTLTMSETENLKVVPRSVEDTWIYKFYNDKTPILPSTRNTDKDRCDYMFIINSKAEFMSKVSAINPFNTDYFVWVDFGLSHVIKNKDNFKILKNLKLTKDILIAAINPVSHNDLTERVSWRFAGGIFICNKYYAKQFYESCQTVITAIFPRLTWEVNVWSLIEQSKLSTISVYYSDHNDSLLLNINPT